MRGTLGISWGKWGGFYCDWSRMNIRICCGWVAFTWLRLDLDDVIEGFLDDADRRRDEQMRAERIAQIQRLHGGRPDAPNVQER